MALTKQHKASLQRILGPTFPSDVSNASDFCERIELGISDYVYAAAFHAFMSAGNTQSRSVYRRIDKYAAALTELLEPKSVTTRMVMMHLASPPSMVKGRSEEESVASLVEARKRRQQALQDVRHALDSLRAAVERITAIPENWGKKRGRGRLGGLQTLQVKLAVVCCESLMSIGVTPTLYRSKRQRYGDKESDYLTLLRWTLDMADRRTKSGRPVTGDVGHIALLGLREFKRR